MDIIGFLIKPQGAYLPWLTVTAILGGVLTPLIWKGLKGVNIKRLQTICIIIFATIGVLGILNHIQIAFFETGSWGQYLLSIGKNVHFTTLGLEITSIVGFLLLLVDHLIKKKFQGSSIYDNFLKLLISVGIPGLIVTTLNTQILRVYIPALSSKAFIAFWIPRVAEELFMTIYVAYMLSLLLHLYNKLFQHK